VSWERKISEYNNLWKFFVIYVFLIPTIEALSDGWRGEEGRM
jgi:hypothetical protein